jgi:ELWxxDGT repeat protein
VFAGDDLRGDRNLWVTDGTAAGTVELEVAGAGGLGLFPCCFSVLGHEVLFNGTDAALAPNLWVTDGTVSGTKELHPAGAYGSGLDPGGFTVLGTEALFAGYDAAGRPNLWVTNGTSAGTNELRVAGESANGLFSGAARGAPEIDPEFTVLGGRALFQGVDARGRLGLWVTNGTSAGTAEITPAEAYSGGLFSSIDPDFAVVGQKVVFAAEDSQFQYGLWVTDGTSAGTRELMVSGAQPFGLFSIELEADFTSFEKRTLFEGRDANNGLNPWITDGTAASTRELFAGSFGGVFNINAPIIADFTVFGSKVLFAGRGTGGSTGLWVTDGSPAGTSELTVARLTLASRPDFTALGGKVLFTDSAALWVTDATVAGTGELRVNGAYSLGLFNGFDPAFAILGKRALLAGFDASHHRNLWVTDGTAAGTVELKVAGSARQGLLEDGVVPDFTPLP